MAVRGIIRAAYSWATRVEALRRPLDAVRSHPRARSLARRHLDVLLASGTTWGNVDGALRLLAEDPGQPIVFGPWRGDAATELLYWAPFVRWAQEHFSLDPARVTVVSRGGVGHWYGSACGTYFDANGHEDILPGAAVFRPEPILALIEEYRDGSAAPRPLLKRVRHVRLQPPAPDRRPPNAFVAVDLAPSAAFPASDTARRVTETVTGALSASGDVVSLDRSHSLGSQHAFLCGATGLVTAYSGIALLAAFSGIPVIALRSSDGHVAEADLDLALRVTSALGSSLTILDVEDFERLHAAVGGG
jgi:hypothetical protein